MAEKSNDLAPRAPYAPDLDPLDSDWTKKIAEIAIGYATKQVLGSRRHRNNHYYWRTVSHDRRKKNRQGGGVEKKADFTVGLALLRLAADDVVAPGGAGVGHLLDAVEEAAEGVVAGGLLGGLDQVVVLGGADVAGLRTKSRRVTLDVEDIICAGGVNICAKAGKHEQLPTTTTRYHCLHNKCKDKKLIKRN
jgi:hypothetical protein